VQTTRAGLLSGPSLVVSILLVVLGVSRDKGATIDPDALALALGVDAALVEQAVGPVDGGGDRLLGFALVFALLAGGGSVVGGVAARDDNVTSEGYALRERRR
jgi:hypothetical protein